MYEYNDTSDSMVEGGRHLIHDRFPAVSNLSAVYPHSQYPYAVAEPIPDHLDAAVWNLQDKRLIFFKGPWVGDH